MNRSPKKTVKSQVDKVAKNIVDDLKKTIDLPTEDKGAYELSVFIRFSAVFFVVSWA